MFGARFWLAWLAGMPLVYGAVVTPPQLGFAQNVGQYDSDVLFALGDRLVYRNKVQLTYALSIQFVGANPSAVPVGKNPVGVPLNVYLGLDPRRWRENVPHYTTVSYLQVYPGIDAEWNSGTGNINTDPPMLRIHVAPGANPQQLRLRLEMVGNLDWAVSGSWLEVRRAGGLVFDQLAAYQPVGTTRQRVAASFVQIDASSFRPEVGSYDPALPLVIEFDSAPNPYLSVGAVKPGYDHVAVLSGEVLYYPSYARRAYVAAVSPDGNPVYLSLLHGVSLGQVVPGRDGGVTAGGIVDWARGFPPVIPGAPRSEGRSGGLPEGWVGRFDSRGRLRAATFTGDALGALAVDPEGAVYFATGDSVVKWVPGNSRFSFIAPVRSVCSLSTNAAGGLAFAAAQAEGQPTTSGAFKRRYEGPWDLYVGVLDRLSGRIQMATYVPVTGRIDGPFTWRSSIALAPGGSLWIASSVYSGGYPPFANTLVAVSADGARELRSESVPSFPEVAFDSRGQAWVVVSTYWPNLPTDADAPRRAGCYSDYNLHLRTLAPDGALLTTTYLAGAGRIIAFDGPDRLFVIGSPYYGQQDDLLRVDTSPPANPGIACAIHTASRHPRTAVAASGLTTLVGNRLGPLEQANAALDGSGELPLTLAGVQVLISQVPAPLVSVQQGLITFYIPEDTPRGYAQVEVRLAGISVTSTALSITPAPDFALLTADGSGRGQAAALNQDGTVNGPNNPAKWGSVVAVFGTGPLPASVPVFVGGLRATVEYAGPAPGAVPGVKQVNFRLSSYAYLTPGWKPALVGPGPFDLPVPLIYVTP